MGALADTLEGVLAILGYVCKCLVDEAEGRVVRAIETFWGELDEKMMVRFDHRRAAFFSVDEPHPRGGAPETEPKYPDIGPLSIRFVESGAI